MAGERRTQGGDSTRWLRAQWKNGVEDGMDVEQLRDGGIQERGRGEGEATAFLACAWERPSSLLLDQPPHDRGIIAPRAHALACLERLLSNAIMLLLMV